MKTSLRICFVWVAMLLSSMPLLAQVINSSVQDFRSEKDIRFLGKERPLLTRTVHPVPTASPAHVITRPEADPRARVAAAPTSETFNYMGNIVSWTVPTNVFLLTIKARGAEGGNDSRSDFGSGQGAIIAGTFAVVPGDELKILVGQRPSPFNDGGGGSFVTDDGNNPLVIAGGGGGSGDTNDSVEKQGQSGTNGGTGAGNGGAGGTSGNGGNAGQRAGGGGLLTNGGNSSAGANTGGKAFINGGSGGNDGFSTAGFGGGGSGSGFSTGGGGGGYSGGGGAGASNGVGGGGGSFNGGTNPTNIAGANAGNGQVIITYNDISCGSSGQNVLICYYGVTQCVSERIAARYQKLGATLGGCNTGSSAARLGLEEAGEVTVKLSLKAFPNPVQDLVTIEVLAPNAGPATFELLDMTGRARQSRQQDLQEGLNEVEFRLGTLPTGLYLIRAQDALNRQGTVKVSKQ